MYDCKFILNDECQISNKQCRQACPIYNHCIECKYRYASFLSDSCVRCEAVSQKMKGEVTDNG